MGGRQKVRALISLRWRALIVTGFGLIILAGLVVFDNTNELRLLAAQRDLETASQLETDNRALTDALASANSALLGYAAGAPTAPSPHAREELLTEYLQAATALNSALDQVDRDAPAADFVSQEQPVREVVTRWQSWAESTRQAVDARGTVKPAAGQLLLDQFQAAEYSFTRSLTAANGGAALALEQRRAEHVHFFYGALGTEALVIVLLAIAVIHGLVNPIGSLTRTAEVLAAGRPIHVPFTRRKDEVGSLARALSAWQQAAADVAHVYERSPLGMARLDAAGRILDSNPSLRRMLPGARLVGARYADLLEAQDGSRFDALLASLIGGERDTFAVEARHHSPARRPFWGNVTGAAVPAPEGAAAAYALVMLEDVDLRKNQELELAHRAAHDPLTGLPNRALFRDRLEQALRAARRRRGELAVLLIDLDRFKPINDELGHHAGDLVLQQLAARMGGSLRQADTVARIGGDEFAVLLAQEGRQGAVAAAHKLMEAASQPFEIDGVQRSIGLSIGISVFPANAASADGLLRRADAAMYEAKRAQSGYRLSGRAAKVAARL